MELDTEHDHGSSILGSHEMMKGGSEWDPDQQVHTKSGSEVDPDLGEGVIMTGTIGNRKKRLPMHVKSSN